jgi:hypothetical protein
MHRSAEPWSSFMLASRNKPAINILSLMHPQELISILTITVSNSKSWATDQPRKRARATTRIVQSSYYKNEATSRLNPWVNALTRGSPAPNCSRLGRAEDSMLQPPHFGVRCGIGFLIIIRGMNGFAIRRHGQAQNRNNLPGAPISPVLDFLTRCRLQRTNPTVEADSREHGKDYECDDHDGLCGPSQERCGHGCKYRHADK